MLGPACLAALILAEEPSAWGYLKKAYDKDGDGKVARSEYTRDDEHFQRLDKDGDGAITAADFDPSGPKKLGGRREGGPPGERGRPAKVGEMAPDFSLEELSGKSADEKSTAPKPTPPGDVGSPPAKEGTPEPIALSSFRGKRPVALVFGSYT